MAPKKKKPYETCKICSQLADKQSAYQKCGDEENDTYLPKVMKKLKVINEWSRTRDKQLLQCTICSTYYLYLTDYEFLISGTEDEQHLTRLSDKETKKYMNKKPK